MRWGEKIMKIKILHTNDIHSRFENLARVSSKIKEIRDENTITLDAGDFNDFMRMELEGTGGRAGVELLDSVSCDALAVGNNETFQGIDMLTRMAQSGKVSFLSCNLCRIDKTPLEGIKRSIILERGGVRFLIIGTSPLLNVFYALSGLGTMDYKEAIEREIGENKGNYDIAILLSHLGLREDRGIAETIEGIDIIIGGHSHVLMDKPEVIKNTVIHQSGSYGENLGVLEFEYEGKIESFNGYNIPVQDMPYDEEIMNLIQENREKAIDNLSTPLYMIDRDLWHDVMEENPVTNLLADALKDVLKCDIGIINSGVINGGIRKGPVTKKKLLEICPSPLNPTSFEIQGKYIREALEKSIYMDFCMQDGKGSGFRGRYLGRLHISGAVILHDGRKIKKIIIDGKELDDERIYKVASSDYLQRGTGYGSLANNTNEKYNIEYLRDTLKDYVSRHEYIEEAFKDRWIRV